MKTLSNRSLFSEYWSRSDFKLIGGQMLDKSAYYHGAALVQILENQECQSIRKIGTLGYLVNDDAFVFLKYSTKSTSPWRFTFDQEDIDRATKMAAQYGRVVFGFVCGGDGVCAVNGDEGRSLLGEKPGFIAADRKHNRSYTVWGAEGDLKRKISLRRWPGIVFHRLENGAASVR